jgi:hypothetical protein
MTPLPFLRVVGCLLQKITVEFWGTLREPIDQALFKCIALVDYKVKR